MAMDPVCGMTVEPSKAAGTVTHAGQTYWFCSPHCLAKFNADSAKYLGGKSGGAGSEAGGGLISSLLKKLKPRRG